MTADSSLPDYLTRLMTWLLVAAAIHLAYTLYRSWQVRRQRPIASYSDEDLTFAFALNPPRRAIYEARGTISRYELAIEGSGLPVSTIDEALKHEDSASR